MILYEQSSIKGRFEMRARVVQMKRQGIGTEFINELETWSIHNHAKYVVSPLPICEAEGPEDILGSRYFFQHMGLQHTTWDLSQQETWVNYGTTRYRARRIDSTARLQICMNRCIAQKPNFLRVKFGSGYFGVSASNGGVTNKEFVQRFQFFNLKFENL